mmetsp:Transcript_44487/g.107666  ORF Transcript_44487/g.107666 Transcript_44487/m.107666 type:complete len:246 (-) Transcript_44487:441-1178(-)
MVGGNTGMSAPLPLPPVLLPPSFPPGGLTSESPPLLFPGPPVVPSPPVTGEDGLKSTGGFPAPIGRSIIEDGIEGCSLVVVVGTLASVDGIPSSPPFIIVGTGTVSGVTAVGACTGDVSMTAGGRFGVVIDGPIISPPPFVPASGGVSTLISPSMVGNAVGDMTPCPGSDPDEVSDGAGAVSLPSALSLLPLPSSLSFPPPPIEMSLPPSMKPESDGGRNTVGGTRPLVSAIGDDGAIDGIGTGT